jgi:hypothetical protein
MGAALGGEGRRTSRAMLIVVWLCHCNLAFDLEDLQGPAAFGSADGAAASAARTSDATLDAPPSESATQGGLDSGNTTPAMSDASVTMDWVGANEEVAMGSGATTGDATDATVADALAQVGDADHVLDVSHTVETGSGEEKAGPDSAFGAGWCATNMTSSTVYCNDFDEPTSTAQGSWDSIFLSGTDCASLDSPLDAPSPPNSLLFSTPPVASGSMYQEQFTKYPTNVNSETLQFALKLGAFDVNAGDISLVRIGYRSGAWSVSLDLAGAGAELYETIENSDGGIQTVGHMVRQPPLGVWTTIALTVDSAANRLALSYDGNPVTITNEVILNPASPGAAFSTIVGLNYLRGPAQPMTISYDNILISVN